MKIEITDDDAGEDPVMEDVLVRLDALEESHRRLVTTVQALKSAQRVTTELQDRPSLQERLQVLKDQKAAQSTEGSLSGLDPTVNQSAAVWLLLETIHGYAVEEEVTLGDVGDAIEDYLQTVGHERWWVAS